LYLLKFCKINQLRLTLEESTIKQKQQVQGFISANKKYAATIISLPVHQCFFATCAELKRDKVLSLPQKETDCVRVKIHKGT
jgi:hypothetical protein